MDNTNILTLATQNYLGLKARNNMEEKPYKTQGLFFVTVFISLEKTNGVEQEHSQMLDAYNGQVRYSFIIIS